MTYLNENYSLNEVKDLYIPSTVKILHFNFDERKILNYILITKIMKKKLKIITK